MFFAVSGIDPTPRAVNAVAPHAGRVLRRRFMERHRFARGAATLRRLKNGVCGKPSG